MMKRDLHVYLHLGRELLDDPRTSLHVHIRAGGGRRVLKQRSAAMERLAEDSSGYMAAGFATAGCTAAEPGSKPVARSGPQAADKRPRKGRQRVRSKMYRLDVVPAADHKPLSHEFIKALDTGHLGYVVLEIASGNQADPVVWEACEPNSQRGLWRLTVREDFGRLMGMVTYARDMGAIWILNDWTPRGSLILEPAAPEKYPRLMLTPLTVFQR